MKSVLLSLLLVTRSAEAETATGATLSADLREEYLAGSPLLVTIEARNETSETITVPDLSVRHDLVRFELRTPSGELQTRRTLVESPAEKVWSIPPRGKREVLLEIPSASTLKPGDYEIAVHFTLGESEQVLEPRPVRLSRPAPVSADLGAAALPSERAGDWTLWLHQTGTAYDLYLNRTAVDNPLVTASEDYLTRLPALTRPILTASRTAEASDRYVVWAEGDRQVGLARLQGHGLRAAPQSIAIPWPKYALTGRGATGSDGRLYQPLWVPAPRGTGGEIGVLSADESGDAVFRRVSRYSAPPDLLRTAVTDAGSVLFLISQSGHLDLYTVQFGNTRADTEGLPVPGERLRAADPSATLIDIQFTILPASGERAGGLAMLGLFQTPGGLQPRWMSLSGEEIATGPALMLPAGAEVVDFSPNGLLSPGLLLRLSDKTLRYQEGEVFQKLGKPKGELALDRDNEGVALLRQLGNPVSITRLQPTTPLVP